MIREDFMEKKEVLKQDFEGWIGFDRQLAGGKNTRGREDFGVDQEPCVFRGQRNGSILETRSIQHCITFFPALGFSHGLYVLC